MSYLLVQSKGECPIEGYTLLGASLSRNEQSLIGQFGSGSKLAICALLRKGLKVIIYSGRTRMEFRHKTVEISDDVSTKQEEQVYIQFGGTTKKKQDLGWTLGYGAMDWQDEGMATREFVSNALDSTVKRGIKVKDAFMDRDLAIEIVDDSSVRAQAGYTRVFIEANDKVTEYVDELPRRFLHFTNTDLGRNILPKVGDRKKAQIYLNGVFVCELKNSADSLCDYNFASDQIKIDESRNLEEYTARAAIARLYRDANVDDLVRIFTALDRGVSCLETSLDAYYLKNHGWESEIESERRRENWRAAWEKVNHDSVACGLDQARIGEFAQRKGYHLGIIKESSWLDAIKDHGVPTVGDVLDDNERKGHTITAPTLEAIDAVNKVWGWITATDLIDTEKCPKPHVKGFDEVTDAESDCFGFYKPGRDEVYLRNDLGGPHLLEVATHEIGHYVCGAQDGSRDFAEFFIRLLIRWLS